MPIGSSTRSAIIERITAPSFLNQVGMVADAAWTAVQARRRPRASGQFLRRALVSGAIGQGSILAVRASSAAALQGSVLIEPLSGFKGPVGDVPVRIAQSWESEPSVLQVNQRLAVVAGPDFEKLSRADQEKAYHRAVTDYRDPAVAVGLVGATAALSYGAHRLLVAGRGDVSRRRGALLGLALTAGTAGLQLLAAQVSTRRRQARVASER